MRRFTDALVTVALLTLALAVAVPAGAQAFSNVKPGDPVDDRALAKVGGGTASLLGPATAKASVFVFVRTGHPRSKQTLSALAKCSEALAGKGVNWSGVVSASSPPEEIAALVKETGFAGDMLLDKGDELYGALGVALHPVVGIADGKRKLASYLPFMELNYCDAVVGSVRRTLGEITQAQLDAILHPAPVTQGGTTQVARRYARMAEKLLAAGDGAAAEASARKSIEADAQGAAGHAVLGAALAAQGKCDDAKKAYKKALSIDPKEPLALEGAKGCQKR